MDTAGVEVLEENSAPLFSDLFSPSQVHQSPQLLQRGVKWTTLPNTLKRRFTGSPRDLLDEWHTGLGIGEVFNEQVERELITRLRDPGVRYLDYFLPEFDHVAHLTHDPRAQLEALQRADALVGRLWAAIRSNPHAQEAMLVVVSDHGTNTDPAVQSQAYNLVAWLGSAPGGGHHVVTNRHPLMEYKLKGLYPFTSAVTTPSRESYYLKGQSNEYPTALIDPDGNERASIYLRDSDLNVIQLLLSELRGERVAPEMRPAVEEAIRATIRKRRGEWQLSLDDLRTELHALLKAIQEEQLSLGQEPNWTDADRTGGADKDWRRQRSRLEERRAYYRQYLQYAQTMTNLLSMAPDPAGSKLSMEQLIPRRAMGERNSIHRLQNYVAGLAPGGLRLRVDGTLDIESSFRRIDYFDTLVSLSVRNNLQKEVSSRPIDFIARRLDARDAVWVTAGPNRQLLIEHRRNSDGELELRCSPVAGLREAETGKIQFDQIAWQPGLPLRLFEDPDLAVEMAHREQWLSEWHTESDWFRAIHRTKYSNGVIGLHEQLMFHEGDVPAQLDRLRLRRRRLVEPDLLVLANDHWNFNVRGFNPGGNHGSFFRISTHSVLMFAGGAKTAVPRGLVIETPYDSLSLAPTLAALMGVAPARPYSGRPIAELTPGISTAIQSKQ